MKFYGCNIEMYNITFLYWTISTVSSSIRRKVVILTKIKSKSDIKEYAILEMDWKCNILLITVILSSVSLYWQKKLKKNHELLWMCIMNLYYKSMNIVLSFQCWMVQSLWWCVEDKKVIYPIMWTVYFVRNQNIGWTIETGNRNVSSND